MMRYTSCLQSKQHGAALITALSILLVLTVLGIATVSTTVLQERMAGNARDYEVAFEQAESGLRAAELYINSLSNINDFSVTGGTGGNKYTKDYNGQAWKTEANWGTATSSSSQVIIQEIDTTVDAAPVETLEPVGHPGTTEVTGRIKVFQITVRGYGLNTNSRVMLQSYYGKTM